MFSDTYFSGISCHTSPIGAMFPRENHPFSVASSPFFRGITAVPFGSEASMTFAGDEAEAPWRSMKISSGKNWDWTYQWTVDYPRNISYKPQKSGNLEISNENEHLTGRMAVWTSKTSQVSSSCMDHLSIDSKVDSLWDSFFEMDKQSPVDLQFQEENMEIQPAKWMLCIQYIIVNHQMPCLFHRRFVSMIAVEVSPSSAQ